MSLRDRLEDAKNDKPLAPVHAQQTGFMGNEVYQELRSRIHRKLLDRVDLTMMERMPPETLRQELKALVERLLSEEPMAINDSERMNMVRDIQHEVLGLGPLEILMADPTVSDILVNTYNQVYVERRGKLELTDVRFENEAHLLKIIDKIVSGVGRRVDESSPMVDARLPDGSRVNAIIPPLAVDGAILSIRRFSLTPLKMNDLIQLKSLTPEMAEILEGLVKAKVNLLISGGTGTGKTTLLNVMSSNIPISERVITIEDAAELQLQQPHVVRLEIRPPNIEGKGEVTPRMLVRNSLRMRPDRIIVGEVRGAEVVDMLQAMNTGHEGSMVTLHANTPRDALTRLENMIGMAGFNLPPKSMREQISSALTAVVHISRLSDGKRKITSIQEITGMEGDVITMQDIFTYEQTGVAADGTVQGHFRATGIRPKFIEILRIHGIAVSEELFDPTHYYE
ncbi:CpaF family protein [Methylotenera sp.]|uniref:CpaF family protein n=1 Tax=Methylotenera sp. TaxID=2051956 RepID=UPI00273612F9|nr:CpaF family protein [Methylotenera sp.]MDP3210462.1 CpaF family protein [Methylotenera sp.]